MDSEIKQQKSNKFGYIAAFVIILIILMGIGVYFFTRSGQITKPVDTQTYISKVNNEYITRADFQEKLHETTKFFEATKQDISKIPSFNSDVLNNMIDEKLISEYAQSNNIKASDSEVLNRYDLVVRGYNGHNNITGGEDTQFLFKIKEMYGTDKNTYLEEVKNDILKEKVQIAVKMPLKDWLEFQKKTADIKIY